jgi:hypothetical protein
MIQSLLFRELYGQLTDGPEGTSQSHAERFDLEFKPFAHFRETALRPIDA